MHAHGTKVNGCTLDLQNEEMEVLESIYADDCMVHREERCCEVYIPNKEHRPTVVLKVHMPDTYPSATAPIVELLAGHLSDDLVKWAVDQLESMYVQGDVVMYNWIEFLKEQPQLYETPGQGSGHNAAATDTRALMLAGNDVEHQDEDEDEDDEDYEYDSDDDDYSDDASSDGCKPAQQRATKYDASYELEALPEGASGQRMPKYRGGLNQELEASVAAVASKIVSTDPYTERKSTFQAHVAPVNSYNEVKAVVAALMQNNKIANATHNMMAYRIHLPEKDTFLQDYDDDGETAAGGRMLHLLQAADVRNVVVLVSRWFGGVKLGPSRFAIINNVARAALEQQGFIKQSSKSVNSSTAASGKGKSRRNK